jgi:hypothetical protein
MRAVIQEETPRRIFPVVKPPWKVLSRVSPKFCTSKINSFPQFSAIKDMAGEEFLTLS